MKKTLLAIGFSVLFGVSTVFGVTETNFPASDIDFTKSTIEVSATSGGAFLSALSCSKISLNNPTSFVAAGWNNSDKVFSKLTDCFHKAGKYTVKIILRDNAGNESVEFEKSFTVVAGDPDDDHSTITPTLNLVGGGTGAVANNLDAYEFAVDIRDEYGNPVPEEQYDNLKVKVENNDTKEDANLKTKFISGLRVDGKVATNKNQVASKNFSLTAIAPSIEKVSAGGQDLARSTNWRLKFIFSGLRLVGDLGNLGAPIDDKEISRNVNFKNPFYAKPGVGTLELDSMVDINVETAKEDGVDNIEQVSNNLNVEINKGKGGFCNNKYNPEEGEDCQEFINESKTVLKGNLIDDWELKKYYNEPDASVLDDNSVAFITKLGYQIAGLDVSYPAGAIGGMFEGLTNIIGLNGGINTKFIGADIEGFVAVDESKSVLGDNSKKIVNIGLNNKSRDIYEEITKNGWSLARNAETKITNNGGTGWQGDFNNSDVVVVDFSGESNKSYTISGALPAGRKTLIVIDGNLVIEGNLEYNSKQDSFGVIMLRNEAGAEPAVGNIFVRSGVQKIAGSFFADGGFMNNDDDTISTGNTQESTNQLLLEGSLLSRNTLGGSWRQDGSENDYSPWSDNVTNKVAQRYDLHFVRRYDSDNPSHTGVSGEANTAAFIIRPDQKSAILPPPGFKVQ